MKINIKGLLVLSITSFILFVFFLGLSKDQQYNTRDLVGKEINNFRLEALVEKKPITREELKNNKFTLINFWASWCSPCRLEHKYLLSLNKDFKVKILGINFKDKNENATKFLEELGNPYFLLAKDNNGKESINFGIYGIPESILINKNLIVIKKFVGPINEDSFKEIIKLINQ